MSIFLTYLQIFISVLLTFLIVIQAKSGGLMSGLGGQGTYHSKKGVEKVVLLATIATAVIFVAISLVNAFIVS